MIFRTTFRTLNETSEGGDFKQDLEGTCCQVQVRLGPDQICSRSGSGSGSGNPASSLVHRRRPKPKFQIPGLVPFNSSLVQLAFLKRIPFYFPVGLDGSGDLFLQEGL